MGDEALTAAADPSVAVALKPRAAGTALVAADTGRVLMLQRALIDGSPSDGKWEFPGGTLEAGEDPLRGAAREFGEETGHPLPPGEVVATWLSGNGVYEGFVVLTATESLFPLGFTDPSNRVVRDPDNWDGRNYTESIAWFDPSDLDRGPRILREEVRSTPWALIKNRGTMTASAETALRGLAELHGFELVQLPEKLEAVAPSSIEEFESLVASIAPADDVLLPSELLPGPTPWTPSEDGLTADGHLALWASCHIGYPGCVKPPREESFDFYNLTPTITAGGRHVGVGRVTFGTGHAGGELSWRTAAAHYDNSGTATYVAHAVPDRWGIRLPSVVVASATPGQIDEARIHPLSGDWRRISGSLRLVASLGVNVPGYPIPQSLVAGGEVQSMFVGFDPADAAAAQVEADELAHSLGLDVGSRMAALRSATLG